MKSSKKRVSEIEKQLQTMENVEKLDLQAKLAEANAKLANAEFGKFERELKDSNDKWLRDGVLGSVSRCNWSFCLAINDRVGAVFWFWLKIYS